MNVVSISGKGPPTQEMCIFVGVSFHNSAKIWIPDFPLEVLTKFMIQGQFPFAQKILGLQTVIWLFASHRPIVVNLHLMCLVGILVWLFHL